jgi:hypothetical protein
MEHLKREPDAVHIRVTARRPEQVATFQQQGQDAVLLDLDRPATFAAALYGVDRAMPARQEPRPTKSGSGWSRNPRVPTKEIVNVVTQNSDIFVNG